MPRRAVLLLAALTTGSACLLAAACGRSGAPRSAAGGPIVVVAAENFWGSIASQLAGEHGRVRSIVVNPETDPHSYEPNAADARALAGAQFVIVNGAGYDAWATRLLRASPAPGRVLLDVASSLRAPDGANPHLWYSPSAVARVADEIAAAYARLDPRARAYFAARRERFKTHALSRYTRLLAEIRACCAGTPVGYSESIFQPLGQSLGLRLLTPSRFAKAIAEGTDVTAADKRTVDALLSQRRVRVWIFNSQNVTPDVERLNAIARARSIPIVTVTETLSPATASFQDWQCAQLERLLAALRAERVR